MKTFKLTEAHEIVVLEKGDTIEPIDQNYIKDTNSEPATFNVWTPPHHIGSFDAILASEITEDQATDITGFEPDGTKGPPCVDSIDILRIYIREALKSNGLMLQVGERPKSVSPFPDTDIEFVSLEQKAYDLTIPLNRILITEK